MYSEAIGSRKTVGDVDVVYHDGLYHLFHLVLPNHDFIAHAVSEDGFTWYRVRNALFLGHPGSWDDSMLWTMHVSRDPHREGGWRMFYTGLSRRDRGLIQRLGMARSDDLFHWEKVPVNWQDHRRKPQSVPEDQAQTFDTDPDSCLPLEADPQFYESSLDEGRHWISWRDPFFFQDGETHWLLCAGRVNSGPVVRRGCVALMQETSRDCFEAMPPLHHPGLYDDVEVPNLLKIRGEYYLIGSIREDAKIRYWHTDSLDHPWRSYYDNVLLAGGNYAGRICHDDQGVLIWNFFTSNALQRTTDNLMPPPKRLVRTESGMLRAVSFEGFDRLVARPGDVSRLESLGCSYSDTSDSCEAREDSAGRIHLSNTSGFDAFLFPEPVHCFRFRCSLRLDGMGKCGLVMRLEEESHDGYFVSLDLTKGVAQMRAWGTGDEWSGEEMMKFQSLQAGFWYTETPGAADIELLAYGSYLELSVDGRVILSLADQTYNVGRLGIYVESSTLEVLDPVLEHLHSPTQSDEHLPEG